MLFFVRSRRTHSGFPEEDDPWIAKFMMETSIPEEYDPITVFVPPGSVARTLGLGFGLESSFKVTGYPEISSET